MHRLVATLGLALIVPSGIAQQSHSSNTAPALTSGDQSAVRGLVNGFADAWNRHDMQTMQDLDTEDVEWVNVVGHHWVGKVTVRRGHTAIHKGMEAKTTMGVESTTTHPITPNVAVVVATLHFFRTPTDPLYTQEPGTRKRGGLSS